MMAGAWVVVHTIFAATQHTSKNYIELKSFKEDLKEILIYILMCIVVFSYEYPIHLAVVVSCVIGCFYVFCAMGWKIFAILTPKHWRWASFMGFNNLFISGTLAFLLYICYG